MDEQILNELKELRYLLSRLIGTSELPLEQKFSQEALDKAAKEFQKLSIERGEWIETYQIRTFPPLNLSYCLYDKSGACFVTRAILI
jgi:hypothetical protein